MKALTLTQPWATLVAIGAKKVETRSWKTEYRGRIAIHAAKGFPDDARYVVTEEPFQRVLREAMGGELVTAANLPTGCIIAMAELAEVRRFDEDSRDRVRQRSDRGELPLFEADFGDYTAGRFGLVLANVVRLSQPIPARGMLNLWNVPADVEHEVLRQLKASHSTDDASMEAASAAMVAAFSAIDKTKLDRGEIPCPKCGGTLAFAHAGPKRHVRAACETEGCLRFMS